jgi:hypothetical protein
VLKFSRTAIVLAVIVCFLSFQHHVSAYISSCAVTISPQSVAPGSDNYYVVGVNNTSDSAIDWIQVISPTGQYFTVESASAYQWQAATSDNDATFTQGSISASNSQNFAVEALTSSTSSSSPLDWQVQVSDDSAGADPTTCSGDTGVSIVEPPTQINISNIGVTDVSSSSATVFWTTDAASTTEVEYGLDTNYDSSSPIDNSLVSSHSVTLDGLDPNSTYYFQVISTTPDGGYANADDNTILTAIEEPTPPISPLPVSLESTTPNNLSSPIGTKITNSGDNSPPKISFTNLPAVKVYKSAPTLTGQATDNVAIQLVEYSTDDGQDWLPAEPTSGLNQPQVNFSFTPVNLPDGTYKILARAINDGGYITNTSPVTIVLDSLPPDVGGNMFSLGPQVLEPNSNGVIVTLAGTSQKITLSAVGGPTSVNLTAQPIGVSSNSQVFGLSESPGLMLWSGTVNIAKPGDYSLQSNSVDGAGIKSDQTLGKIDVIADPYTYDLLSGKPISSKLTLYYLDQDSNSWVVWDGSSYDENNPQYTNRGGSYKLFVPPGKYYLKVEAMGYETLLSSIFSTAQTEPLTTDLGLKPLSGLSVGPINLSLSAFAVQTVNLTVNAKTSTTTTGQLNELIGQPLPNFSLTSTSGATVQTADLLGHPTLIVLGSIWSPSMENELPILSKLQTNQNFNIEPIALQQNSGEVSAYTSIAGLNLSWLVDPDSSLTSVFGSPNLPTQIFVDRNGIVRQIYVGNLSLNQTKNRLSDLLAL